MSDAAEARVLPHQPWSSGRAKARLRWLTLPVWLWACASPLEPVSSIRPLDLRADEGLLIVQVDTDAPLEQVSLDGGLVVSRHLRAGRHVWISRVRAGRYAWSAVVFADRASIGSKTLDLQRLERALRESEDWARGDEFGFEVKAGTIGYPGSLIVRTGQGSSGRGGSPIVRHRNRLAMALRDLLGTQGALLEAFPIAYTGPGRDRFVEHYLRARDRVREDGGAAP